MKLLVNTKHNRTYTLSNTKNTNEVAVHMQYIDRVTKDTHFLWCESNDGVITFVPIHEVTAIVLVG